MNDNPARPKRTPRLREDGPPDFAAQMAKAEFGRHYVDPGRLQQSLENGEIVFRHRKASRGS